MIEVNYPWYIEIFTSSILFHFMHIMPLLALYAVSSLYFGVKKGTLYGVIAVSAAYLFGFLFPPAAYTIFSTLYVTTMYGQPITLLMLLSFRKKNAALVHILSFALVLSMLSHLAWGYKTAIEVNTYMGYR